MEARPDASAEAASRRLAGHVAGTGYAALPPEAVHGFKRACLDYFAVAVSGAAMPVSRAVLEYFRDNDGRSDACVVGTEVRLSCPNAAMVNGANAHGLDFDDGYTQGSTHPAGATFPAVFAIAERHGCAPRRVVAAMTLAYDVTLRIAAAMHPGSARKGLHNTPNAGVFGAAAGVSSLLGSDAATTGHALGLAGSFASGIREYLAEGAEVKRIHPGKAARDGLICAELARRGVTGPTKILEGRFGFFNLVADGRPDWGKLFGGLGREFRISDAYFKPYPCCRHFHALVDAVRILQARRPFGPDAVRRLELGLYEVGVMGHDHKRAANLLDAQMSAPVVAALAIARGDLTARSFAPDMLADPAVNRLADRTDVRVDPECEQAYPARRSGRVRIELTDGTRLEERVIDPRGEGNNPMSDGDLERKFIANCEPLIGRGKCDRLIDAIWRFERLPDLGAFFDWSDGRTDA
jgi:2-methylcitrate dehydratase PrpD